MLLLLLLLLLLPFRARDCCLKRVLDATKSLLSVSFESTLVDFCFERLDPLPLGFDFDFDFDLDLDFTFVLFEFLDPFELLLLSI